MAKLCVVATGLLALAPPREEEPSARILLRKVSPNQRIGSIAIAPHRGLVRIRSGTEIQDIDLQEGENVSFTPDGGGSPQIRNRQFFLPIGRNFSKALPANSRCRNGECPFLAGRIILTGGIINPIELDDILDLRQVRREIRAMLKGGKVLAENGARRLRERPAANGFLFERELDEEAGAPSIVVSDREPIALAPTPRNALGFLDDGSGQDTYVVWVVNIARRADGRPGQKNQSVRAEAEAKRVAAERGQGEEPVGFDPDFHLLYDFVEMDGNSERLVPLVSDPDEGPGEPPGRCIPGITG